MLGPAYLHRLTASECILNDVTRVEDTQAGLRAVQRVGHGQCLAETVRERRDRAGRAALHQPRFRPTRLRPTAGDVDAAILAGLPGATISEGAQNGSEMGAFAREGNPIKERSLRIKYEEFMPLGLTPVIIHTT